MTASAKTAEVKETVHKPKREDAPKLPGVLFLLRDTLLTTWNLRVIVYGYTAWLLVPIVITVFSQSVPSPFGNYLVLVSDALGLVLGLWVTAVIILYVAVAATQTQDEDINFAELGKVAWEKVLMLFIIQVFTMCLVVFGTILFAIPGIIAWVWTAFALHEALLANRSVGSAFKHSRELTRGRFLAIFGRLFVANLAFALTVVLAFAIYLGLGLQGSVGEIIPTLYAWPDWLDVGFSLIMLPLTPIAIIFHLLLYFAVKKSYSAANV